MPNYLQRSGVPGDATAVTPRRGAKAACVMLLLCVLILLSPGASGDASEFSRRKVESGVASAAISTRVVPVYVRASNGSGGEHAACMDNIYGGCKFGNEDRFDDRRVDLGGQGGAVGGGALMACGGTEENACPDIRTGLQAIPKYMPKGTSPELRLLPGLYTGNNNVFFGDPSETDFPDSARDVRLVGWIASAGIDATGYVGSALTIPRVNANETVISCQGRQSQNESSPATRGVWLRGGRITQLANITVTDCPAGGVGVDLSPVSGDGLSSSPASLSLSSVKILENGGDDCQQGGGLYVTVTSSGRSSREAGAGRGEGGAAGGGGSNNSVLTLSGCLIANNTADLGGGIAVVPSIPLSFTAPSPVTGVNLVDRKHDGTPRPRGPLEMGPVEEPVHHAEGEQRADLPRNLDDAPRLPTAQRAQTLPFLPAESGPPNIDDQTSLRDRSTLQDGHDTQPQSIEFSSVQIVLDEGTVLLGNRAASGGGAWASKATVSVVGGALVKGNVARGMKEGCGEEESCAGRGGGMSIDGGSLHLQDVRFEGNRAEAHQARDEHAKGGGLSIKAAVVDADGCTFARNSAVAVVKASAGVGGAAFFDGVNATLSSCRFEENSAEGSDLFGQLGSFGGGVVARGPTCSAVISNSTFVGNTVRRGGSGGALWVEDGAFANISSTTLINNAAASSYTRKGTGGAVAISASAKLVVSEGSLLKGNSAGPEEVVASDPHCLSGEGGAIYASGSGLNLTDVTLAWNRCETGALDAGCSGGAISITGSGPSPAPAEAARSLAQGGGAVFDGCVFDGNEARGAPVDSVYSGAGRGGAAAVRFAFPLFTGCNFTANSAGGGDGAAPATGGAVLVFLSKAGGGGYQGADAAVPTFVDCVFEDNRAGSGTPTTTSQRWDGPGEEARQGRRGHGIGGALAAIASSPLLNRCSFRNNSAFADFPSSGGSGDGIGGQSALSGASPSFGGAIVLTSDCSGTRMNNCMLEANVALGGVGGDLAVLAAPSERHPASLGQFAADIATATAGAAKADAATPLDNSDLRTAVLSGCKFSPAPPQTDPAVNPWCDGRSETSESPFLFLLDGGTVELVFPIFSAPGQAFVAQVDGKALAWDDGGSGAAHLRIIDDPASASPPGAKRRIHPEYVGHSRIPHTFRSPNTEVSLVSVGATITLLGTDSNIISIGEHERGHHRPADGVVKAEKGSPFPLHDLILLHGELVLSDRGAKVSRSARIRMGGASSASGTSSPILDSHDTRSTDRATAPSAAAASPTMRGDDAIVGENAYAGREHAPSADSTVDLFLFRSRSGSGNGGVRVSSNGVDGSLRSPSSDAAVGGAIGPPALDDATLYDDGAGAATVAVEITGEALLGEAWEPKPFFLGTSLSQVLPSPPPTPTGVPLPKETTVPSYMKRVPRSRSLQEDVENIVVKDRGYSVPTLSSFLPREESGERTVGQDDAVTFEGVNLELRGSSRVRGDIILLDSASVKIDRRGSLTLVGNATFRRPSSHAATTSDKSGESPLFPPSGSTEFTPVLVIYGSLSIPRGFSLTTAGGIEQGRTGTTFLALPSPLYSPEAGFEGVPSEAGWRGASGGLHPLVVESGAAKLGGAIEASVVSYGGDEERIKMHRKWAVMRYTAAAAEFGSLSVRGPPGVSMKFSLHPMVTKGAEPQETSHLNSHVGTSARHTEDRRGRGLGWDKQAPEGPWDGGNGEEEQWLLIVEAAFIECWNMLAYANVSAAGGPCQACLLNLDCAWCGGGVGRGCIPAAEGPTWLDYGRKRDGSCQVGNCCPGGCNGVGECDFFSGTCWCRWLYAGSSCGELSTRGAVALSLSLSALALVMLSLACGRSSRRKQMEAVVGTLQELKRGLLSDADGSVADDESSVVSGRSGFGGGRMAFNIGGRGQLTGRGGGAIGGGAGGGGGGSYQHMWPRDYIQDLQQNLALRDVMVSFSELELSHKIGSGAAGSVWRGSWRGAAVAVKVIRRPFHQAVELTGRDLEVFKREAYLMTRLRHPNIVLIMGVTFAPAGHHITLDGQGSVSKSRRKELGFDDRGAGEQGSLCIVTELLSQGSLEDVIREGGLRTASYALILNLALQAARGMLYLHTHSPPIVHRDLKSSNLVVDEHWHVKVTDFGMSRFVPEPPPASVNATNARAFLAASPALPTASPTTSNGIKMAGSGPTPPLSTPHGSNEGDIAGRISRSSSHEEQKNRSENGTPAVMQDYVRRGGRGGRDAAAAAKGRETGGGVGGAEWGLTTNLGTVAWAAPEMLLAAESGRGEYTSKARMGGCVLFWCGALGAVGAASALRRPTKSIRHRRHCRGGGKAYDRARVPASVRRAHPTVLASGPIVSTLFPGYCGRPGSRAWFRRVSYGAVNISSQCMPTSAR